MAAPADGTANAPQDGAGRYLGGEYNDYDGFFYASRKLQVAGTFLASAARTATPTVPTINIRGHRGIIVIVDITVIPGSAPSNTYTIQGKDPVSGKTWTLLASAALAAVATTILRVYPGLTASANVTASDVLPSQVTVSASHGNANSVTYSLSYVLIP